MPREELLVGVDQHSGIVHRECGLAEADRTVDGMTDSLEFAKEIVRRCKVGLAPGAAFGPAGEGYLRLCFASSPERLGEALERLGPMLG